MEAQSLYEFFYRGAWLPVLWGVSWQGAVAIALVWPITRWRRVHPHVRVWVWRLVLIKMLAGLYVGAVVLSVNLSFPWPTPSPAVDIAGWRLSLLFGLLGMIWTGGVVLGLFDLLRSWRLTWRLRRECREASLPALRLLLELKRQMGIPLVPELHSHPALGPMLVDLWRPMIILPAALLEGEQPETLRAVLAHELAHLRARDLRWGWVTALAELVFFFHPLVRLAVRECLLAQEMACDAQAIAETGQAQADYGAILVHVAAAGVARPRLVAVGVSESFTALHRRLQAMAHCRPLTSWRRLGMDALLGLLALIVLLPAGLLAQLLPDPEEPQFTPPSAHYRSPAAPAPLAATSYAPPQPAPGFIPTAANPPAAPPRENLPPAGDTSTPPGGLRVDEGNGDFVLVAFQPKGYIMYYGPDAAGTLRRLDSITFDKPRTPAQMLSTGIEYCDAKLVGALARQFPEVMQEPRDAYYPGTLVNHVLIARTRSRTIVPDRPGTVAVLIEAGADPNARFLPYGSTEETTALHMAAERGMTAEIEALLAHGAQLNAVDGAGETPLYHALCTGNDDAAAVLRKHGGVEETVGQPIHQAAAAGNTAEVTKLLQDSPQSVDLCDPWQRTPLVLAAACGQEDLVRLLLDQGADPNYRPRRGSLTALGMAAQRGDAAMAELLLAHGANVNDHVYQLPTPLWTAVRRVGNYADLGGYDVREQPSERHFAVVKLLLEHGGDTEIPYYRGSPLLNLVLAQSINLTLLELLFQHGANPNATDNGGPPVLYYALPRGLPLVKLLVEHGADVNYKDNKGRSLLQYNECPIPQEVRDYLKTHGAK